MVRSWNARRANQRFGYLDGSQRPAWYQTVTTRENLPGLRLQTDDRATTLLLLHHADAIGQWHYHVIARRLFEKHRSTVFVGAHTRGRGAAEEVHYVRLVWCRSPSVDRFLQLVRDGDILIELRMYAASATRIRNHGTAFRLRRNRIADLYEERSVLRTSESD